MPSQDPVSMNVSGVTELVQSGMNKTRGGVTGEEGVIGQFEDALTLKLDDEELLLLAGLTESRYAGYEGRIKPRQQAMKAYYLGRQSEGSASATDGGPIAANLIFEAEETFLPAALSKNPEPVVWSDNTTEGEDQASDIKTMLQYHADVLVLRRKLNRMTRQWSVNFLGILKHGWDTQINDILTETRDAKNFIFDPDGHIDELGDYQGSLLGERVPCSAEKLTKLFPKHAAFITVMVDGNMGTKVQYTEWWTNEYCFYTFKNKILDKTKNPHFNHDKTVKDIDEDGNIVDIPQEGKNHFPKPKMPYTFLSVYTFGDHPHDDTGLIEQNIPQQNLISKRTSQIDTNFDRSNNSLGLSGANFNEETAKQAAMAMRKGNPILIPAGGPVSEAVARFPAPDVPAGMFTTLESNKNDLRQIFGTQGITAQQPNEDQTARGMILNQQYDTSRIGGGIGDALEQVADNVFNWWVQLYYVYYDEPHFATIIGQMKAVNYVILSNRGLKKKCVVSVAPNSMKPKDEVTDMNQAMALWDKGAMDPKSLFTILDFPDPQKMAEQVVLWRSDPQTYIRLNFPDLFQQLQQSAQAAAAGGAPQGGGAAPEQANGEPAGGISTDPASPALSQVPLPAV